MNNRMVLTPADEALFAFDAENHVEPVRTIAERIAAKHGAGPTHSLVDDISRAIEDAYSLGERRGELVRKGRVALISD
jgi:hypothetical protein